MQVGEECKTNEQVNESKQLFKFYEILMFSLWWFPAYFVHKPHFLGGVSSILYPTLML